MRNAMFVRPTNPVSHRLARMAFIMACVAALIVASAGPLHRYLGLEIEPAFAIFRYGFYVAVAGAAPRAQIVAQPRDAVRWTLYYQPVLDTRTEQLGAGEPWQPAATRSIDAFFPQSITKSPPRRLNTTAPSTPGAHTTGPSKIWRR